MYIPLNKDLPINYYCLALISCVGGITLQTNMETFCVESENLQMF